MFQPPTDRLAEVRTLSEQLPRFMRVVHALKSQATDSRDRADTLPGSPDGGTPADLHPARENR